VTTTAIQATAGAREELLGMGRAQLARVLAQGHTIDAEALADSEYRGISLGLPRWMERLTWKTFQKTFHRDAKTGELRGWNVRVQQRGLDAPSTALVRDGARFTFGHYRVVALPPRTPRGLTAGLLIDYSPDGGLLSRMRDPIVSLDEGSVERLLGWSYVDLGFARVPTPSYFLLEREGPLSHVAPRPS
jgi:hypothetical protein